jgi:hypothetical protein
MNRHQAMGTLNDTINIEGSGGSEWFSRTKPNKSLNPTGNSLSFIRKIEGLIRFFPAGYLRR